MKSLIVCTSVSHGNTRRVADTLAPVLAAKIVTPEEVDPAELSACDLVGFGSGIFTGSFHPQLRAFVAALPEKPRGKAFVFATSGFPDAGLTRFSAPMVRLVEEKGFEVVGTFSCRAWDTFAPFKLVGGIRKGRPSASDLERAHTFAEGLKRRG